MPMLQACLNGSHSPADRPGVPVTPAELADAAARVVAAGAHSLHVHPRDARGRDTALGLPLLLHGEDSVAWAMVDRALRCGFDTWIGLEDTGRLPDGLHARDNGVLVGAAVARHQQAIEADERLLGAEVRIVQAPPAA